MQAEGRKGPAETFPGRGQGTDPGGIPPPALGGARAAERAAAAGDGGYLRHGHPGQRTAVFHRGGNPAGPGGGHQQREKPDGISSGKASEGAAAVRKDENDRRRTSVCHPDRAASGPPQHLARYESPVPGGGSGGGKSLPPQPAASVRKDVLWAGEGYRAAGGYSGAFRCEHDADLHYGVRGDAQETAGADAAGDMKNHGMMIPW